MGGGKGFFGQRGKIGNNIHVYDEFQDDHLNIRIEIYYFAINYREEMEKERTTFLMNSEM